MSNPARAGRTRRGRVMMVGDLPELAHLAPQLQQPPLQVGNMFQALGEVTTATAASPISTVVIAEKCLVAGNERAVESLRKLDPSVRVILISSQSKSVSASGTASEKTTRGVDDCLTLPLRPEDVSRVFDEELLMSGAAAQQTIDIPVQPTLVEAPPFSPPSRTINVIEIESDDDEPATTKLPAEATVLNVEFQMPHAESLRELIERSVPAQPPTQVEPVPNQHAPPVPAPPPRQPAAALPRQVPAAEALGDTDLIQAIMSSTENIRDIAMRLIIQQTCWHDITFLDRDDAASTQVLINQQPQSRTVTDVNLGSQTFGRLSTNMAQQHQLQPWADWLARWLALDHAFTSYRTLAYKDDLTTAWNRRFFESFLGDSIAQAAKARRPVTVMVFDIDNFKTYNDHFGHDAGDDVLRETVNLLNSVIRQGDRVCRIGGDEFAVIFADPEAPREPGSTHPESVEFIAKRFQDQICKMRFPKLGVHAPGNLSISAGLATYPWDGHDASALLRHADQLALQSKRSGKNWITLGPGTQEMCRKSS